MSKFRVGDQVIAMDFTLSEYQDDLTATLINMWPHMDEVVGTVGVVESVPQEASGLMVANVRFPHAHAEGGVAYSWPVVALEPVSFDPTLRAWQEFVKEQEASHEDTA